MKKGDPAIVRKNIKAAREKAGLTQNEVVDKLAGEGLTMTQTAYSGLENRMEYFQYKLLVALSDMFKVDICYFLVEHPDAASAVAEGGEDE